MARLKFKKTRTAFSLVELIATIITIAVLAKVAIPRYSGAVARYRLTNCVNRVVADLNNARAQAMATSQNVTVTFTTGTQSYAISNMPGLNDPAAVYTVSLAAYPYKISGLGASFGASLTYVTFDGYGVPNNTGSVSIIAGGTVKTITVEATTGKVIVS